MQGAAKQGLTAGRGCLIQGWPAGRMTASLVVHG